MHKNHSTNSRIAFSTGAISLATALSRILGFVRDLLIAGLFGTLEQAQAFVVAFRLPNLLRDMVAEGAVSSAFVPILSAYRAKGDEEKFWKASSALFARMFVAVLAIGVAGAVFAPFIVRLIAPGFVAEPEKFALTVKLTRILFPFITLVGVWAYFMGLLNSLRHFVIPSLGPAVLNIAMIIACVWFVPRVHPGVMALAIAILIGGAVQLLMQIPIAMKLGFRWKLSWHSESSKDVMRLLGPRMIGSSVYQLNVLIDTALASLSTIVGQGAVAALYFANRLVQLPLAVFGTASAQASLPTLAEQAASGNTKEFHQTLLSILKMMSFVIVPSAIGLIALAFPIVGGLFQRGAFDHAATMMTSQALIFYSLGLLGYSINKVLTGAFYALHDTWTPVKLTFKAVLISVTLSLVLMFPMRLAGLALAASVSNLINAYQLLSSMQKRLGRTLIAPLVRPLVKITIASVVMGAVCFGAWAIISPLLGTIASLILSIVGGILLYGVSCALLGVTELSSALRWIKSLSKSEPTCENE
jgi:putative peptidoglycan lipid II flippase